MYCHAEFIYDNTKTYEQFHSITNIVMPAGGN